MKRLFSLMLALILACSLGATAFADEPTGSITISNVTPEKTYAVYKLFNATYNETTKAVSYTIAPDSAFYDDLFTAGGTPTATNTCFEIVNGNIKRVGSVSDATLMEYVVSLIGLADNMNAFVAQHTAAADENTFTFDNLPYGYYVVTSTLGTTVTITNNTPSVSVIDKNQNPAVNGEFQKKILGGNGNWVDSNTAAVGDLEKYQVSFTASNYYGKEPIQYYTIYDEKGDSLWVEFGSNVHPENNIKITVNGTELKRGYYLPIKNIATAGAWEWDYIGDWTGAAKTPDNAEWYLVHESYDKFRIMIPWMTNHTVSGSQDTEWGLQFNRDSAVTAIPKYENNAKVVIEYYASVEPGAQIGGGADRNLFNKAQLTWTCAHSDGNTDWDSVYTEVFGLALRKIDSVDLVALAGAEFAIFKDEACNEPLYVIPTDIDGVYIRDDLNAPGQQITGTNKLTARELYAAKLTEYLGSETQKNRVTTPVNGKIVILGLDAGTYYLKETDAPDGYNELSTKFSIVVNEGMSDFHVFADEDGKVADLQAPNGEFTNHTYHVTSADIPNSKGVELPSTGGTGTMMLITIGAVVAMAFAVLLITHKKMSIYHD